MQFNTLSDFFDLQPAELAAQTPTAQEGDAASYRVLATVLGVAAQPVTLNCARADGGAPTAVRSVSFPGLTLRQLAQLGFVPPSASAPDALPEVGFGDVNIKLDGARRTLALKGRGAGLSSAFAGLPLQDLGVSVVLEVPRTGLPRSRQAVLTGTLRVGDGLPFELLMPSGLYGWRLSTKPGASVTLADGLEGLSTLVGSDIGSLLPGDLPGLGDFSLSGLGVSFSTSPANVSRFDLTVSSGAVWPLITDTLNVKDLRISLSLARGAQAAGGGVKVGGLIAGTVELFDVDVQVEIPVPPAAGGFSLRAYPNFLFEGLGELEQLASELAGTGGLGDFLPPGLDSLGSLEVQFLEVVFDPAKKALLGVGFRVVSEGAWQVPYLEGVALEKVLIDLSIANPANSATRQVTGTLGGTLGLGSAYLPVRISRQSALAGWRLVVPYEGISVGLNDLVGLMGISADDFKNSLPPNLSILSDLSLTSLNVDYDLTEKKLRTVSCGVSLREPWEIIPDYLTVNNISIGLGATEVADPALRQLTANIGAELEVAGVSFVLTARKTDPLTGWVFGGEMAPGATVSLSSLAAALLPEGTGLPDEVPDVELSGVGLTITPLTGEFTIKGRCLTTWELPFGAPGLAVSALDFSLRRGPATGTGAQARRGRIGCSLKLTGTGPVQIVEGLVFESLALGFDLDPVTGWTLSGSVGASILDTKYTLAASLQQTQTFRRISLAASATSAALVSLDGVGSLSGKAVALNIVKAITPPATAPTAGTQSTAATTQPPSTTTPATMTTTTATTTVPTAGTTADPLTGAVPLSPTSPYGWDLTVVGGLKIDGVLNLEGALLLFNQTDRAGLAFRAANAEVKIPLPVPDESIDLHLGLDYISVVRTKAAGAAPSWAFDARVNVWFTGLPASIQKILAQKVTGQFKVDAAGTLISINRVLQPVEVRVPDAQAGGMTIEFGTMLLDASNLSLRAQGGTVSLSMDFGVGLPEGLNNVFGKKSDGTPSVRLFNTYVKENPLSVTRFRLAIGTAGGLTIQTVTSPLAAVRLVNEGVNSWWHVDLGEFGKVKLMVPVFSYTGDSFVARGGFQQIEPLKVPLTPLKLLLSAAGLRAAADALPKGIPLQELNIYDARTNEFRLDDFVNALEKLGGFTLPSEVKDALRFIESRLDALPDRFKSYLDAEIPDRFEFNISVTPDGGARGRIWVTGDKPIKLLYPTMSPFGLMMTGIELYSLTFGEILGGALFLLSVDVRVDQYDLTTLLAALGLPLDELPLLPDTRALSRRVIVKDLFMLIIYQTGVPAPVPLFFDRLGLEYLGLEGLELQTHWGFPKPKLSPSDAGAVFRDFENFFTRPDHLLAADSPPQGLDLKLVIGPNYIGLPEYLGGKSLGSKDEEIVVSAYSSLAHLFNALKTLSLNELIQALPLEKRVGTEQVSFSGMTLAADWLITTPREFRDVSHKRFGVADAEVEQTLQVLPPSPSKNEEGLVVFLRGVWSIAGTASLGASFGLVGTSAGFGTGMRVSGRVNDLLEAELSGVVVIDTKAKDVFRLSGHSRLRVLGDDVFTGDLNVTEDSFAISGRLDLFPRSRVLRITGELAGRASDAEFYIFGGAKVTAGGFFKLAGATAELTHTGVRVSGTWLGQTATFSAQRVGGGVQLKATLSPLSVGDAFKLSDAAGEGGPVAVLGVAEGDLPSLLVSGRLYLLGIGAAAEVSFSEKGFRFDAEGKIFDRFDARVQASGIDLLDGGRFRVKATMKNDLLAYLKEHATQAIDDAAGSATRRIADAQSKVDAAQKEVDSLERQIDAARRTVQAERARDQKRLEDAQADVRRAESKVNGLQSEIDSANRKIRKLEQDIKDKKKWVDRGNVFEKATRGIEFTAYAAKKGAEIGALETEIAGLKSAKATANFALDAARKTLGGLKSASEMVPVDADPRVSGLIASKATATGALTVAKEALAGVKASVGALATVGDYIVKFGLGGLLDVRAAGFDATLNAASGGSVTMSADVVFMGRPQSANFTFNFQNPLTGAQNLAQKLLYSQK